MVIGLIKHIPIVNRLLTWLDSSLFKSFFIQNLLQASVQFESGFFSRNVFVTIFHFFIYMWLLNYYFEGLSLLTYSFGSVTIIKILKVFFVFWTSFYLKLRMTALNYVYLEINTSTTTWNILIEKFKQKEKLDFINVIPSDDTVALVSMKCESYTGFRDSMKIVFHDMSIKSIAGTVEDTAKVSAKAIGENSDSAKVAAGLVLASGVSYDFLKSYLAEEEKRTAALEKVAEDIRKIVEIYEKNNTNGLVCENSALEIRRSDSVGVNDINPETGAILKKVLKNLFDTFL